MKPLFDSLARARKTEFIMKLWHNNIAEMFERRILAVRGAGSAVAATATAIPATILAQQLTGTLMTLMV